MKAKFILIGGMALVNLPGTIRASEADVGAWGREVMETIERDHAMEAPGAYYEDEDRNDVAFTWGIAKLTLAYNKAAEVDSAYKDRVEKLVEHQNRYWVETNGIGGYDHLPHPRSGVERYYDDNAWVAMALIEAYNNLGNEEYLARARETIEFSLSGEAESGGIYWREDPKETVNTCSVAPTAFACLGYYGITGEERYLEKAKELMNWLDETLRDEDALYWDKINPETGRIDRTKWTYNSGMPLQNYVRLYNITGDEEYLRKARAIAEGAEDHWFDEETGEISCASMFAWTLIEGWVELSAATGESRWRDLAYKSLSHVYNNLRDENGRYPGRWDAEVNGEIERWQLLYPAGVARAFWVFAASAQEY